MATNIVTVIEQNSQSPFDSIRHADEDGEFWLGREFMEILGYPRWHDFEDVIEKAKASCKNAGNSVIENFSGLTLKSQGRPKQDYRLSRYAAYLVAQNGDPRKTQVASAQTYFAVKTREAELIIPAQNAEIEKLRLQNENLKLEHGVLALKSSMLTMHGKETGLMLLGYGDRVIETEKPILEVVNHRTNQHFQGQTCKQVAEYIEKRTGKRFKSGADIERCIRQMGRDDLITYVERPAKQACVSKEKLEEVYQLIQSGDRQILMGEGQCA